MSDKKSNGNFYCSVVLQGSAQVQYNCKCNRIKQFLYCSCTVVVLHLCGPLNHLFSESAVFLKPDACQRKML